MGYRINLSNANSIGQLVEGNVISFIKQTLLDENYFEGNTKYIEGILSQDNRDFITSHPLEFVKNRGFLSRKWRDIKRELRHLYDRVRYVENQGELDKIVLENREVLKFFKEVSYLLSRYQLKFLVLPGFDNNELNNILINREELIRWLRFRSINSYLILQLKEIPKKDDVQILDSFIHFEKALSKIDDWPGVLIWDKRDSFFLPLKEIDGFIQKLSLLEFERNFIKLLKSQYDSNREVNNAHLLHLSDLHIGKGSQLVKENRLLQLLRNHLVNNNPTLGVYTLISGDLIDNPTESNATKYNDFKDKLELIGLKKPITVLGNHDLHFSGLLRTGKQLKNAISSLGADEDVVILEELGLIIVKFNSNIDGKLAQGKIGTEQLAKIGNTLDRIPNLNSYCLIAMLHHHPFELTSPNWMKETWYEQIIGKFWMNESLKLVDSDIFIEWINGRGIKYIIHGHKHIPTLFDRGNINVISAGSSTGNINHENNSKTFLTYNYINYDVDLRQPLSTTIVFEDLMGAGTRHYQIQKY